MQVIFKLVKAQQNIFYSTYIFGSAGGGHSIDSLVLLIISVWIISALFVIMVQRKVFFNVSRNLNDKKPGITMDYHYGVPSSWISKEYDRIVICDMLIVLGAIYVNERHNEVALW